MVKWFKVPSNFVWGNLTFCFLVLGQIFDVINDAQTGASIKDLIDDLWMCTWLIGTGIVINISGLIVIYVHRYHEKKQNQN